MARAQTGTWFGLLAAGASLMALACGCGGDGDALSKAPVQLAAAVCPRAHECCTPQKLMGNELAGSDVASCQALTRDELASQFESIRASQRRRRATFDEARFRQCVETIRSSSCEALNEVNHLSAVPGCGDYVIPGVQPGGACFSDWDCVAGWCQREDESGQASGGDGVCVARQAAGAPCEMDKECADDMVCRRSSCVALAGEGDFCLAPEDCRSGACDRPAGAITGLCISSEPPPDRCFYESACSYAGAGPASLAASILAALLAAAALRRRAPVKKSAVP